VSGSSSREAQYLRRTFKRVRNRLAVQLCNSEVKVITSHTSSRWKEEMEYVKTKDILHVMLLLGHKNIKTRSDTISSSTSRKTNTSAKSMALSSSENANEESIAVAC